MFSTPANFLPETERENLIPCIRAWLDDQQDRDYLVLTQDDMDEASESPTRASSPPKRQRTLNTTSDTDLRWAAFKEPSSATSASRATSPSKNVRSRRIQLEFTNPMISFGPPKQTSDTSLFPSQMIDPPIPQDTTTSTLDETDASASIPPELCDLVKRFSEEAANRILPSEIVSRIIKASPTEFLELNTPNAPPLTSTSRDLHKHVSTLFSMAQDLYTGSYEEAAWYPLVRIILVGPPSTDPRPFIKHEEAHTRLVCSDLLPQRNGTPIAPVKIDHVLQFNTENRHIHLSYKPVFQSQPPWFSLSAFNDPVAAQTFTCAVVEVKAPSGDFLEASYQIAITSAAILERVKLLGDKTGGASNSHDFMPAIGWIVHGHFWTLHVSYREVDGSIRVLGPYPSGNTATYLGLYRLVQIIQEVKDWGQELYFPYLAAKLSCWQ